MNGSPVAGNSTAQERVRTRRVYYVSGFDPRGAAHYYRLYKEEAEKQGVNVGYQIELGPRRRVGRHQHGWNIEFNWHGESVATDYRFLSWDDIVRRNWESNPFRLLATTCKSYAKFVACGALGRIRTLYRGPFYSGVYPLAALLLIALLGAVAGGAAGGVAHELGAHIVAAWMIGLSALSAALVAGYKLADRMGVLWLLRTYLFVYSHGESASEEITQRISEFADTIMQDLKDHPCDEVLLVGHSVGSILAVSLLSRILNSSVESPKLTLVTLGQCIPLLSLIPAAAAFRHDLKLLAEHPDVPWLDKGARIDPLCFSQIDPVAASGIVSPDLKWPRMHAVRPFRMFSPENYKQIRRDKLRLHFQYLMSSELQTNYDYFLLTAGPVRISLTEAGIESPTG